MKFYKKGVSLLHTLMMILVSAGLVIMICVTALEVVRRYVFGLSFSWSEELVKYLMIMVAFFGGAVAYRDKGLVSLDLLTGKLSKKAQIVIELLSETVAVALIAMLFWFSLQSVLKPGVYRQISIGLKVSMAIPWAPLPIGFGAMLFFAPEHYYQLFSRLMGKDGEQA